MPITKQAEKKLRHDRKRVIKTMKVRETVREVVKAMRKSPTVKSLREVHSALDKAAKLNIIHKNKAARLKSRLSSLLK